MLRFAQNEKIYPRGDKNLPGKSYSFCPNVFTKKPHTILCSTCILHLVAIREMFASSSSVWFCYSQYPSSYPFVAAGTAAPPPRSIVVFTCEKWTKAKTERKKGGKVTTRQKSHVCSFAAVGKGGERIRQMGITSIFPKLKTTFT